MKKPSYASLTVFILFFGLALIEAIQRKNWLAAALFTALGLMSLRADLGERKPKA